MKICDARLQGRGLGGQRLIGHDAAIGARDDLVQLSDAFDSSLRDWQTFQPGLIGTDAVTGGEHVLEPTAGAAGGSFWYNANDGFLRFRVVDGDVRAVLDCHVRNSANSGLPPVTEFRIAGISLHDPDTSVDFDYVHVGLGSTNNADLRAEHKSTVASVSDPLNGDSPGFSSVSWPSGSGQVEIERVGHDFTMWVRSGPAGARTLVRRISRAAAPMPRRLRLAIMCYANVAGHDIELHCRGIVVSRP